MEVARGAGMHALAFQLKRGHLQTVTWAQRLFDEEEVLGMTAARFDVLYALRREVLKGDWLTGRPLHIFARTHSQASLGCTLGLHRSTIHVIVKRLEEMGWIERVRSAADRRCKVLALTELGVRKLVHAMKVLFRRKFARRVFERAFHPERFDLSGATPETKQAFVKAVYDTYAVVRRVAVFFGDVSNLHYALSRGT
jgi:DNA-binding MarR family transcriptional regulator